MNLVGTGLQIIVRVSFTVRVRVRI